LIAGLAILGVHFDSTTGVVHLRMPDGLELDAVVPENKRQYKKLVVMADSQNPSDPPKFYTREEWAQFLRRVRAGYFDYLGTDRMPKDLSESVSRLMELGLGWLVDRLKTPRGGGHQNGVVLAGREVLYRQFLILMLLYPNQQLVPVTLVDDFLDNHVLDTKRWREDMLWALGWVPDHDPGFGAGDADAMSKLEAQFQLTVELYLHHFGTIIEQGKRPVVGKRNPLGVPTHQLVAA
jgi:hypothetical protein